MAIAILLNKLSIGGAQKQAILLAELMSKKYQTTLILIHDEIDSKYDQWIQQADLDIVILKGNFLIKIFSLHSLLKVKKTRYLFTYLLTSNVLGGIVGKIAGVKFRIGGIRNALLHPKKEIIERFIHNQLNIKTIFNNYSGVQYYTNRRFRADKIVIIPNCIQLNYSEQSKVSKNINIVSVGRFVKQKDYFCAIQAIKLLLQEGYRNIHYFIIGFGTMQTEIENKINRDNLEKYISVIVNPPDLDAYYKKADIYLCTSIFEGLSNSILEAMSYSLPVVATDVGDNKYIVKNENNGFLIKPNNPKEVMTSLISLLENTTKIHKMGKESFQMVENGFSQKAFEEKYLNLIKELESP